jgi:hypothetical protein
MEIRKIGTEGATPYQPREIQREELERETVKARQDKIEISSNDENWIEFILDSALESLENNIQYDNSHPLSTYENRPIETPQEALAELEYFKSDQFIKDALGAQANILPEKVLSLFEGEMAV